MEDKQVFKKRLGHSPDQGDSFVYGNYIPPDLELVMEGEATEEDEIYI